MTEINYDEIVSQAAPGVEPQPQPDIPVPAPGATGPSPIDYDKLVGSTVEQQTRQQFLETLKASKDIVPERQAQAIETAKLRGVPVGVAYKYLEDLQPKPVAADYDSMTHKAPATAKLLADPVRGPVAFPDAKPLADIEDNLKAFTRRLDYGPKLPPATNLLPNLTPEQSAFEQGKRVKDAADAVKAAEDKVKANAEWNRQAIMQSILDQRTRDQLNPDGIASGERFNPNSDLTTYSAGADQRAVDAAKGDLAVAQQVAPTQSWMVDRMNTVAREILSATAQVAAGLGHNANAQMALNPLAGAANMLAEKLGIVPTDKFGRDPVTAWLDTLPGELRGLFPEDKAQAGDLSHRLVAGVSGSLPMIMGAILTRGRSLEPEVMAGLVGMLQQAGQGAQDAIDHGASRSVVNATTLLNDVLGVSEMVPFSVWANAGGKGFTAFANSLIEGGITEAVQNVGQQVPGDLWAQYFFDPKRDVAGNAIEAGKMGLGVGLLFGGFFHVANSVADANQQRLLALGEQMKKTRLSELSRKIFDEHVGEMKATGQIFESVTAPVRALQTLFQELTPEQITEQFPETAKSLEEARQHQGNDEKAAAVEVTIPTEELLRLGKLKGYDSFTTDVRVGDDLTFNEKMDETKKLLADLGKMDTSTNATAQEDSPVFQNIRDQLVAAGQSKEVATAQARLFDAFFTTQSERTGVPVADLARRHGIEISNTAMEGATGTTTLQQSILDAPLKIDPNTPVPMVTLQGAVPASFDGMSEKAWIKQNLQGQEFTTADGSKVRISSQTSKMAVSNQNDPRRAVVLRNLPEVIRNAVIYSELPDTKGRQNLSYVYAASQVEIEGKPYSVGLSFSKSGEGNLTAYQLAGYEVIPPGAQMTPSAQVSGLVSPGGKPAEDGTRGASTMPRTIGQVVGDFKAQTLFQTADAGADNADAVAAEETTPDVAPAVEAASLDAANTLSKSKIWEKGRDLKMAIQNSVLNVLSKLGLDPIVRSGPSLHYLTAVGVKDALAALEQNPNAIGWYDVKTRQALAVMALVHPEILKDENARFAFTWALAVTSNGIKVGKNFELADEVYKRFKADGQMPSDIKAGNAQAAINDSLQLFNHLRDRWGMDNLRKFMLTDFTVKEITGIDPELKPTGEAIDEVVRGAAVLGPKIGNGFFSNLYGNFDALTMDRWLVRTWGRWTGTLIELDQPNIENSRTRLRQALKGLDRQALADALRALTKKTKTKGETGIKPGDREALIQAIRTLEYGRGKGALEAGADTNVDALAFAVNKASMEPKFRSAMNAVQGGEELRLAGNSLAKYLDGQKEQPGGKRLTGPNERRYIREVFNNVLATLKQDPRYAEFKMADLQAVLWYAEKRLYETAKEDAVVQDGDVAGGDVSGYEDEEALDYANAAASRARETGVSERKINVALKREADNGRPEAARPGDAGTGSADGAAVAGSQGGQQVPARGFARDEKRSFIQREALDRVRSNRVGDAEQSWSYARGSGADGARPRVLKALGVSYVAEWKAGGDLATVFRANGISTPTILELEPGSAKNAAQFVSAISTARDTLGPIGEAVKVYSPEEYADMRLFVTKDGQSGFALKPDGDIVSVFSAKGAGNGRAVMETAIAAGGKKLDCFATILPDFYAAHGFRATSRLLWNDEIAMADMPNWDKVAMARFNNGEPDVVFMVYDPSFNGEYDRKGTPLKSGENGYDMAVKAQERAMRAVSKAAATKTSEPPSGGSSASGTTLNQGGKEIRGSISFTPLRDKFRITLTEKANLSTFIHEGGHFFLEVLQDLVERGEASPQQVADLSTLKKWMGLAGAETKQGPSRPIDREGHEKFARSWEQYIMEGKAPSLALHGIFQKFKAWMIFVYKRLANVRGDLNDEIRSVMDRLVASDAAIAEARAQVGWRGAPLTQEQTGFTEAEQKAYEAAWIKANDLQSVDADARIMLEAARELQQTWKDEKTKVTKEVEAELAQTRGWKAWKLLQDGEGLEEYGRTTIKIDPDSIPKEWRRDTAGMTASVDQGGMDLDMVAELLGFDTGEQMLQSIGGAKLAQKAIGARVRQIMVERHGEMDASQLAQEAMRAVHNTPTMDVLLTEFRALSAKANLKVGKDAGRMVFAAAQERVAQTQARKLEPAKWRRAEVKAAEEAGKLAAQGKDMDAALAKRRQLMAAAMARASLEAQDRVVAIKDYLSTFATNRRRAALGKAGDTYLDQVDQILEDIQFKNVSLKAIKARQGLNEFLKEQEAQGEPVFISDDTRALLGRRNYTEMTLEELEGIHDAVKNLWTVAKEINTVRKGAEKIALENALADIEKETESLLPVKKQRDHLNPTKIGKMMEGISRYHAGNLKIEFILDWLGNTAHSLIYQPITNAAYESWKLHRDLTVPFMDKLNSMPKDQKRRWNTKRQFLNYPIPLKGANIWTIALNMGNASNKEKMLASVADGGFGWTETQVMAELNTFMTKEDWDLAQEAWDTINSMWPKMEAVVKKATGLSPPKIEATEVQTPYGTYRGGYFPVVYDREIDARMDEIIDRSVSTEDMFAKNFTAFAVTNGFTKGRTTVKGKLLFDPKIIAEHLGEVIHYATHYEAVKQADKIIRSPAFKALVKSRLGDNVYAEMKQWLKDVASNTAKSDRVQQSGGRFLRYLRNSAQLSNLGFNILSALKQPLGIVNALDAIGPIHWAHGVQQALLSPNVVKNWKEAFAHSKELGPLLKNYDRDLANISRAYADNLGNRTAQGVYVAAFAPLSVMQSVANVATWYGAFNQAMSQGMTEQNAYDAADKVVRMTQGSGALKDLSGMQRGGEDSKLFTMFSSYFSIVNNRMADIQVRERGLAKIHRKTARYVVLLLLPSLLNMLADDAWDAMFHPDRKEKNDATPFLTRLALETVGSAVAAFPIVKEFYSGAEAIFSDKRPRSLPAFGVIEQLFRAGSTLKDITVEGKPLTRSKARNLVQAAGTVSNTPIYGVYRAIDDFFGAKIFDE